MLRSQYGPLISAKQYQQLDHKLRKSCGPISCLATFYPDMTDKTHQNEPLGQRGPIDQSYS